MLTKLSKFALFTVGGQSAPECGTYPGLNGWLWGGSRQSQYGVSLAADRSQMGRRTLPAGAGEAGVRHATKTSAKV